MASIALRQKHPQGSEKIGPLYLQVIINRKAFFHGLNYKWPRENINFKLNEVSERWKGDKEAHDVNLLVRKEMARINDILITLRLQGRTATVELIKKYLKNKKNLNCFLVYMEGRIKQRHKSGQIDYQTFQSHMVTLMHLTEFSGKELLFADLDFRTAEKFDGFLAKVRNNSTNGRWGKHRNFRTYLNEAEREGIEFTHPYNYYKIRSDQSNYSSLTQAEFNKLLLVYNEGSLIDKHKRVLRRFLFGCFTGLRISDIKNILKADIKDGWIYYSPIKGSRIRRKLVKVPLVPKAKELLDEEIKAFGEKTFQFCEQHSNRELKIIAERVGVKTRIHNHVSRETFATLFIENGGSLDALKEYLGHASLKTTERYLHTSKNRLQAQSDFISQMGAK